MRSLKGPLDHAAVAFLLLLSVVLHLELLPYAFDDAYIHIRVAEHLVEEGAPYYNGGQAVMASSSPAWTLVLAALFALLGPGLWGIAALNAFLAVLGALLAAEVFHQLSRESASRGLWWLVAGVYFALVHFSSVGLMETPLALATALAGLLAYLRGRPAAFLALGAAPFIRPELGALVLLVLGHQLFSRRLRWRPVALFSLAGSLPFLAYQLFFFGTAVPHTATVKGLVYELSHGHAAWFLGGFVLPGHPLIATRGARWLVAALLAAALLIVLAEAVGRRLPGRGVALLLLGSGCATAAVYVAARGLVFPWYAPLISVPVVVALASVAARSPLAPVRLLFFLAVGLSCGADLLSSTVAALGDPAGFRYFAANARVRQYRAIGARLYDRYPEARLLSSEIGGLGHTFRGELFDGVGLITPDALKHHPMAVPAQRAAGFYGCIPAAYVREVRPELIVSMDIFIEEFMRSAERADYVLTREPLYVEEDRTRAKGPLLWRSRYMNVFVRRDLARAARSRPTP